MKIFSLDTSISDQNSGIEHAIFDRIRSFRHLSEDCYAVTTEWTPKAYSYIDKFIHPEEYINLFDFYQWQGRLVNHNKVSMRKIITISDVIESLNEVNDKDLLVEDENRDNAYSNEYLTLEFDVDEHERVQSITYLSMNEIMKIEYYDSEGFLSMTAFFNHDGSRNQTWWSPEGVPIITNTIRMKKIAGTFSLEETGWTLVSYKNGEQSKDVFDNFTQLKTRFLDDLNRFFDGDNIFVIDRGAEIQESVKAMQTNRKTLYHIHNSHATDINDEQYSTLNNHYRMAFLERDLFDGFIVATGKQKHDIERRFPGINVYQIPVGSVKHGYRDSLAESHVKRKPFSMITTARHESSKRIELMIDVLHNVREAGINATLDTYGYWDRSDDNIAEKRIMAKVKDYDLEDAYTAHGYTDNIKNVQRGSEIYLLTSEMEGFNIAMMEAMSNGVVPVSFNVNYGPAEMIESGKNGILIENESIDEMSNAVIRLFNDRTLLEQMSKHAVEDSSRFSEARIAELWKGVIDEIK